MATATVAAVKKGTSESTSYFKNLVTALRAYPGRRKIDQHVRKAIETGHLTAVIQCIQQPKKSTISLRTPNVLTYALRGARAEAQKAEWSQKSIERAMKRFRSLLVAMDSEEQGFGKLEKSDDPRRSPKVLGVLLELAAVKATKDGGRDIDGLVKPAASRLLDVCKTHSEILDQEWVAPKIGPIDIVLDNVPIWHGLTLAQNILGSQMPQPQLAKQITGIYSTGLSKVIDQLKAKDPKENSYAGDAIRIWENCMQA